MCAWNFLSRLAALVVAVVIMFAAGQALAATRVALVIGNGAYQSVLQLPNPPRDAGDVADSLTRLGFAVTRSADPARGAENLPSVAKTSSPSGNARDNV